MRLLVWLIFALLVLVLDFFDLVCLRGAGRDLFLAGGRARVTESGYAYVSKCALVCVAPEGAHSRGILGRGWGSDDG
jgi:hypothetical protein